MNMCLSDAPPFAGQVPASTVAAVAGSPSMMAEESTVSLSSEEVVASAVLSAKRTIERKHHIHVLC